MEHVKIADRRVGPGEPCFIIAEMSANHGQDLDAALGIVRAAASAGADAIKVQTFTPDLHTIDSKKEWFRVGGDENPESWRNQTFYDLYKKAYLPWEWHKPLQEAAEKAGLIFFSTPVEETGVDFLETLHVPCYKVASYEATDLEFLKKVASTGKPVIISVGFASEDEIKEALDTLRAGGAKGVIALYCTTSYQSDAIKDKTNLRTMLAIRDRFDVLVGFSDNMGGIRVPILAAAMGACVIEKHLVVEHDSAVLDDRFSLDSEDFKRMVETIRDHETIAGQVHYGTQTEAEEHNKKFRRSLCAVEDIKRGELFTKKNIRSIRPGAGLPPKHLPEIIGKKAACDIEKGSPLEKRMILE